MIENDEVVLRGPVPEWHKPEVVEQLLGNQWVPGAADLEFAVVNPARETTMHRFAGADLQQVTVAAESAGRAFPAWSATSPWERGSILRRAAELMRKRIETISLNLTLEQGKPVAEARAEILGSAAVIDWFAEECTRCEGRMVPSRKVGLSQTVIARPVGPVAALTPWNSPLGTSVRTVAAALAAGCTVVLKPAAETPWSVLGFARALLDAGLPWGTFNLLFGNAAEISATLIKHPAIRKISFTGSVSAGRTLARQAGEAIKPISLELGGHAPVILFEDIDISDVAKQVAAAKFDNAGQICISPSRLFVHRSIHDEFVDSMAREVRCLRLGEGWVEGVDMGPLANAQRVSEIDCLVRDCTKNGATVVIGGARAGTCGYFYRPTVLVNVPSSSEIMNKEPFGPVASIVSFEREEDVIERANALPYGLAGYVFSGDSARLDRVAKKIDVGMVGLNNFEISTPELPFTGVKSSGFGYACGKEGLQNFLVHHTLTHRVTGYP